MPTYAYATARQPELTERLAQPPEDYGGLYHDSPEVRPLPCEARTGLRSCDDVLTEGDTLILWDLADCWGTLAQARKQLAQWHERGVTVYFARLDVKLGQNTPEILRLLSGCTWEKPPNPKCERPLPADVIPYIGFGWNARLWRGKWQVGSDEHVRQVQAMIVQMHDDGLTWQQIATSLNLAKLWVLRRQKIRIGSKSKMKSVEAKMLVRWNSQSARRAYTKELELREFEHAYANGSLPESVRQVAVGRGWFTPPESVNRILCQHAKLYNRWHVRGRSGQRDAALAPASGTPGNPEPAGGDNGADRAGGPPKP